MEDFSETLFELQKLVIAKNPDPEIIRKFEEVKQKWNYFQAEHKKLSELFQLNSSSSSSPKIIGSDDELLVQAILSPPKFNNVIDLNYSCQSYENLFTRRKNQNSQNVTFTLSPLLSPRFPSPSPTNVMNIVNRMNGLSASSSSPSLSPSPTFSENSADFVSTSTIIRQRGHESRYELFRETFEPQSLETLTCFVLNFIQVETSVLFDTLEQCPNLKCIELLRVVFLGPFNRKVELPNLKYFTMHFNSSTKNLYDSSKQITQEHLQNLLFFGHWDKEEPIPPKMTKIELVVDGWTQLRINLVRGIFISRLPFANDILHRLGSRFKLRCLALQACKFKPMMAFSAFQDLKYLSVQSIVTTTQELIQVLKECKDLQEIRFKNYIDGGRIFLKDIPNERLQFLCFGLCTYTLSVRYSPGIKFDNLHTLIFPTNTMDDETLNNLPSIFKTRKAVVYLCSAGMKCKNGYFVLDKLLQIEGIEWIWMYNFRRSISEADLELKDQVHLYETYEDFLLKAGLKDLNCASLLLEKTTEVTPGFTIGHTLNSESKQQHKWIGREMSKEEKQVLEFQFQDGHKFCSWEAYVKRY